MTTCNGDKAGKLAQAYLEGVLAQVDAERFEEHYFDCPRCLERVQALEAVRFAVARNPIPVAPVAVSKAARSKRVGLAVSLAAALAIVGFVSLRTLPGHAPQPPAVAQLPAPAAHPAAQHPALAQLADLALPTYLAPALRSEGEQPQFHQGMAAYAAGEYRRAIPLLAQVPAASRENLAARFYLGICQMREGDLGQAAAALRAIAALGDSPQQEASLYYLAQIALRANDLRSAQRYLARTVALRGDYEARARAQQHKLASLAPETGPGIDAPKRP